MFRFRHAYFNAELVSAIATEGDQVKIYMCGDSEPWTFTCDNEAAAEQEQLRAVALWQDASITQTAMNEPTEPTERGFQDQ